MLYSTKESNDNHSYNIFSESWMNLAVGFVHRSVYYAIHGFHQFKIGLVWLSKSER